MALALAFPYPAVSSQDEKTDTEKLYSEIAGDYAFSLEEGTYIITFFKRDGSLFGYDHDDKEEVKLEPVDLEQLEFETANSESVYFFLKFYRDDEGKVTRMQISANGREIEGDKIKTEFDCFSSIAPLIPCRSNVYSVPDDSVT